MVEGERRGMLGEKGDAGGEGRIRWGGGEVGQK